MFDRAAGTPCVSDGGKSSSDGAESRQARQNEGNKSDGGFSRDPGRSLKCRLRDQSGSVDPAERVQVERGDGDARSVTHRRPDRRALFGRAFDAHAKAQPCRLSMRCGAISCRSRAMSDETQRVWR
jgi:hypothetical protein